jgi:hypothetical protein
MTLICLRKSRLDRVCCERKYAREFLSRGGLVRLIPGVGGLESLWKKCRYNEPWVNRTNVGGLVILHASTVTVASVTPLNQGCDREVTYQEE